MLLKLTPFQNVAANQTAILDLMALVQGRVLDRVYLQLGGTFTKTQINDLRVKANNKIIYQSSGDRLDKINQYRGLTANASYITVDFTEPRAKDLLDQKLGSIDTGPSSGIKTLTMEVDIGGATSPTLAAWADCSWQSTQVAQTADIIGKMLYFPVNVGATAALFPITIPIGRQQGSLIKRIHFIPPAAGITINGGEIRKNGVPVFQATVATNNFVNTEFQRVAQTGWLHADFINDGNFYGNVLNAAEADTMEYYLDVTVTTAGTVGVAVELLDTLGNN